MNEIKIFKHGKLGNIRTMTDEQGEPWFVAADVAKALGYTNPRKAVADHVDEEDKTRNDSLHVNGTAPILINESGLYSLILQCKMAQAKDFKRWVTAEVLPQIRKTGGYIPLAPDDDELSAMAKAQAVLSSTLARKETLISYQQAQLEAQAPKVRFYDAVAECDTTCSVAELAKMLNANGVKVGQNRLFEWMRNNNYLCTRGGQFYNTPYQQYVEAGLFRIEVQHYTSVNGNPHISYTTRVTTKGQNYFLNGFLSGRFAM